MENKWLSFARINVVIYFIVGLLMFLVIWITGEFRENLSGNMFELLLLFGISVLNIFSALHITYRLRRGERVCLLSKAIVVIFFIGVIIVTLFYGSPTNAPSSLFYTTKR